MGRKSNNGRQNTFRDILKEIKSSGKALKVQKLPEYYIITEGQTEKWYLTHLKNAGKINFTFQEPKSVNGRDYLTEFDREINKISTIPRQKIICIFDVDIFYGSQTRFTAYTKFMAKHHKVIICNNMPSIEFWFLLHFSKTTITKYYNKTELLTELTQHSPFVNKSEQALKSESFLKPVNWFNDLCGNNFTNLNTAIANAKTNHGITENKHMNKVASPTDCNVSYSDMYKLFEINQQKQNNKNKRKTTP